MKKIPYTQKDFAWVKWSPKDMEKQVALLLENKKETYKKVKAILPEERTFENTVVALERSEGVYGSVFHFLSILQECSPKASVREAIHRTLTAVSEKMIDLDYDRDLYIAVLEYYEGNYHDEKKELRKEDIKLLEESLREYKRAGFEKDEKVQKQVKVLLKKISKLSLSFRTNINNYTDYILCTKEELSGLSERYVESLPRDAHGKYIVSLAYPHLFPFLSQGEHREKRKELSLKNLRRGGVKNLKIINELVILRHTVARLLGYANHGDYRTETRMAKSAKNVDVFQEKLIRAIAPKAKQDVALLTSFAKTLGIQKMEHYDVSFVATKLKKRLYDIDPEIVRSYFPLGHVLKELFSLAEKLFSIRMQKTNIKLWHKDVDVYEVKESKGGALIGYFAVDLFPREGKYGHAMCSDVVVSQETAYRSGRMVTPFATLVCNFPQSTKKNPSLLSIGEVETLFHEFGHGLHMVFGTSVHEAQSGANVAWDFVETPSQIMENWVWGDAQLTKLSSHVVTKKSIPKELRHKLLEGKRFQNAYHYMRQLIMGKLDMDMHTEKVKDACKAYRMMNKKYLNITLPEKDTLFPAGFGHLVGYDAGYYSYLWALVYACDAFSEFEKKGVTNKEIGMRWRKEVLEKGSSIDEERLMQNFLKRKSNQKAFLREVLG